VSVLRGHSVFSSPPQRPMTSDSEGFLSQMLSITFLSYLNSSEITSISLLMLSAKQGNYWYHFFNVLGMTRSLTGDCTRDLPHSMPAFSVKANKFNNVPPSFVGELTSSLFPWHLFLTFNLENESDTFNKNVCDMTFILVPPKVPLFGVKLSHV